MCTFSPETALGLAFVKEAGFVGDARHIYYCVSAVEGDRDVSTLWLVDRLSGGLDERHERVAGPFRDPRRVRPSPDASRVAFLAEVDEVAQICVAEVGSGEVTVVTALRQGVSGAPAWSPGGDALAFTAGPERARDPSLPYRVTRPTWRYEGVGLIDDAVRDVHVVDLATGTVRRLTDDRSVHEDPRWSPDGRRILFRASFPPDGADWTAKPAAHVVDVASGAREVVAGGWGGVLDAAWGGGGRIAFVGVRAEPGTADVHDGRHDVWTVAAGEPPVCRTAGLAAGVGVWLEFDHPTWAEFYGARLRVDPAAGTAYVSAQRGGDVGICRVSLSGPERAEFVVAEEGRACFLADADPATGDLLYVASTLLDAPELYLRKGGAERRVTRLNDDLLREVARPRAHTLDVTVPGGTRIDAWALTPPGEGPFPAVLAIHGGPWDAYGHVFMADHQLLVGAGLAVVFANFRSSGGYGTAFMRALDGRWGELGERDHHAVADAAVAAGLADPDRLGVYGLSHGGFATCWLLGRTGRFRAGVAENPVVNFVSSYGTMDASWWLPPLLGGRPDEVPEVYAERSPLTYARGCAAPLLFVVGEDDLRCPPLEAEQYYRALRADGRPAEMLRLPGSGHVGSWTGPVPARAAQNEALVEWFTRHLLHDTGGTDDEIGEISEMGEMGDAGGGRDTAAAPEPGATAGRRPR